MGPPAPALNHVQMTATAVVTRETSVVSHNILCKFPICLTCTCRIIYVSSCRGGEGNLLNYRKCCMYYMCMTGKIRFWLIK